MKTKRRLAEHWFELGRTMFGVDISCNYGNNPSKLTLKMFVIKK